ncbi:2-phosphoglycerate kinase [Deinococcus irradiatisoli]|uniref:2-phosphoglycerate kinase n=1 Tax=Deinococcus irradiatisoli TaxID=2202254 RepID=A0A2Z3JCV9_9DEIO|nr:2-phosphoglycerate kinase [Deinococcus irradiatisoli]AWN22775.1 2-phosphoglycerate kinase [Deinococcus irradiatisoli]
MTRELRIGSPGRQWPFSRGLVAESLLNAGASAEMASAVARRVEAELRSGRRSNVSTAQLKAAVVEASRSMGGDDLAEVVEQQTAAFEDILVVAKKGALPFSRGVLSRSLEDTGLPPREAYALASRIDIRLRQQGVRSLSVTDIDDLTERTLQEVYGETLQRTYRFLRENRGRLGVLGSSGDAPTPFSKGILTQSLLAAGVPPDSARKVARITQRQLRGAEDRVIERRAIRDKVERLLEVEVGPEVAERYRLLQVIRHPPRPLVILLGGVSGTGKSYLAAEIAYRLGIARVVSTDSIREVMRSMVSPALLPTLHASTFTAWQALVDPNEEQPEHPSTEALLAGFREQVQQVSVGLDAVVRRSIEEGMSVVLEGVHLVPGYLSARHGAIVIPMLVTLPDADEHRRHFEARDKQTTQSRPLHRYMRYFDEIRVMQRDLELLARRLKVPMLDSFSIDESADQAVDVVMRRLLAELSPAERLSLLGQERAGDVGNGDPGHEEPLAGDEGG